MRCSILWHKKHFTKGVPFPFDFSSPLGSSILALKNASISYAYLVFGVQIRP